MTFSELFLIAVGLSMDAFAVSICKGLSVQKPKPRHFLAVGLWFGGFQALMPTIGYLLGATFERYIVAIDHWIAFVLLAFIGGNMIKEAVSGEEDDLNASCSVQTMFPLAVATSIDALAVGITLALLPGMRIVPSALLIGCTTFVISAAGLWVGSVFGTRFKQRAEIAGGMILILIGVKILLEHLGILAI